MARGDRVLAFGLLALILVAQHVSAYVAQPLDNSSDGKKSDDKKSDDKKSGGKKSDDKKSGGKSSDDNDSDHKIKYTRLILVAYQNLDTNTNMSVVGAGAAGSTVTYSTPIYVTKAMNNKIGVHNLHAVNQWGGYIMAWCSVNMGNGIITTSGTVDWTKKVARLAVTGSTGAYTGYSGTAFMYALDDGKSVEDSARHQLVLKLFKPAYYSS